MNKQEVFQKIEASKSPFEEDKTFNHALDIALDIVKLLDEPEKTLLSKKEAEWIEKLRERNPNTEEMIVSILSPRGGCDFVFKYKDRTYELPYKLYKGKEKYGSVRKRLVRAVLYGYVLNPLYTAKLKSTNEYLDYDKDYKEIRHFKVPDDVANKVEGYHFTEDELKKYNAWENEAYEVNEVKYDD